MPPRASSRFQRAADNGAWVLWVRAKNRNALAVAGNTVNGSLIGCMVDDNVVGFEPVGDPYREGGPSPNRAKNGVQCGVLTRFQAASDFVW